MSAPFKFIWQKTGLMERMHDSGSRVKQKQGAKKTQTRTHLNLKVSQGSRNITAKHDRAAGRANEQGAGEQRR